MRRTLGTIIFVMILLVGLGLGEVAWRTLSAASCQDWQAELRNRVESYARMHLPDPAPQVQVQTTCGHAYVPDALYFRWHQLSWRLGWRTQKPLDDSDLRLAATRDLMQHPDMGNLKFTVRFDPALSAEIRKRIEAVVSRYLMVEEPRQRLEFRRSKKLPETPAARGSILALETPQSAAAEPEIPAPLFPGMEPPLKASLIRASNAFFSALFLCLAGSFLLSLLRQSRRKKAAATQTTAAAPQPSLGILVAPRVIQDFGERGREVWRLLLQLDPERAARRVRQAWEKDREGLVQFLGWVDAPTRESMLQSLSTDQLLHITDVPQAQQAQRAGLRMLLDLARELAQCSQLATAPLFLHLMTRREWQRVAQQMTRPRRRALAELLDKERASWLRARQDLHPGWFQTGSKEVMTDDQLVRRVRSLLQIDADHLREQLYADRDALAVIDSYFAELTLDNSLNSDLMMLVLGDCHHRQAGFGRLVERQDQTLFTALGTCEDAQVALLLYESDAAIKAQVYEALPARAESIAALVQNLENDRSHSKSLRMQSRSLQRFMERQILVADLLCSNGVPA